MHLTLFIPELLWPEPADQAAWADLSAPALQWLIARASTQHRPPQAFEYALTQCFLAGDPAQHPLAALRLSGESTATTSPGDEGCWFCADPVHLHFHQERIVLADAGAFRITEKEAGQLIDTLNATFGKEACFFAPDPKRWYVRLPSTVDHPAAPISALAGRRLDSTLDHTRYPLNPWLNEIQMVLHSHPINQAREQAGEPSINSLWLWGGGGSSARQALIATAPTRVFANTPLARGLARHMPEEAENGLSPLPERCPKHFSSSHTLAVLDQCLPHVLYEDRAAWRQALSTLDQNWFAPAQKALGKTVDRITLIAPTVYGTLHFTVDAADRWKFWKSSTTLLDLAQTLAHAP